MSEYQFYEFRAIDKPLSKEDRAEIGSWSSRTEASNTGAIFTYSYGGFRQDVITVVEKYFDALFYISNWGTTRLMFKFPKGLLKIKKIRPYCSQDGLQIIEKQNFILLDIQYSDEEGGGQWIEGDGLLTSLISLRDDILNEDYRCLYLIWLKDSTTAVEGDYGPFSSNDLEPPVPKGLNELNGALQDFVDAFDIGKDYISAAAENSTPPPIDKPIELANYLDQLSENEQQDFLKRLLKDEPFLSLKLKTRLKEFTGSNDTSTTESPGRRVGEIIERAREIKRERKNKAKIERQQLHLQKMKALEGKEIQLWEAIYRLIAEKKPKSYDEAIELLKELKDLSIYKDRFDDFCKKVDLIGRAHV